jgi:hypothetical protein
MQFTKYKHELLHDNTLKFGVNDGLKSTAGGILPSAE